MSGATVSGVAPTTNCIVMPAIATAVILAGP
jgi:hypothetical protein